MTQDRVTVTRTRGRVMAGLLGALVAGPLGLVIGGAMGTHTESREIAPKLPPSWDRTAGRIGAALWIAFVLGAVALAVFS